MSRRCGVAATEYPHPKESLWLIASPTFGVSARRATDVVNHGRMGPKGLYGSTPWARSPDRLTRPLIRQAGHLVETDWATAMGKIVQVSQRLLAQNGPLTHGFYTSGQMFLEEYYTLGMIWKAGLGTPHMDGNTRLCTATAAAAMKESFGADGQPGSYTDIEHCDAIFLFGHNMAETQTVLWMRILDRTRGQQPPKVVCVDPRRTPRGTGGRTYRRCSPGASGGHQPGPDERVDA